MAAIESEKIEKKDRAEIEQMLAEIRPLYREWADLAVRAQAIGSKMRGFEAKIATLLNFEEGYEKRSKAAESRIAQAERAAQTRLATIEHGHKTLIDDLSKKQLEADKVKADAEALNRRLLDERAELAALKQMFEEKLASVNAVKKPK